MTWLHLNKCEIKQPVTFSKPHVCERIFIHKNYEKTKLYKWSIWSMVRTVNGTKSLVIGKIGILDKALITTIAIIIA